MKRLIRIAQYLHRPPQESRAREGEKSWTLVAILVALLVTTAGIFGSIFLIEVSGGVKTNPYRFHGPSSWSFLARSTNVHEYCNPKQLNSTQCIASPDNPTLWESPSFKNNHEDKEKILALKGKDFWIGKIISPEELRNAKYQNFDHYILNFFAEKYEVWVDGKFYSSGTLNFNDVPVILRFPLSRFAEESPLYLAIKIENGINATFPEVISLIKQEGFASSSAAANFMTFMGFYPVLSSFMSLIFTLMIGFLFFSLWLMKKKRKEFGFMAIFLFAFSLSQFFQNNALSWLQFSVSPSVNIFFLCAEANTAILLAASFARLRRVFFVFTIPLLLILTIFVPIIFESTTSVYYAPQFISFWYTPVFYLIAAFLCFLQFYALVPMNFGGKTIHKRMQDLIIFGGTLTLIGLAYAFASYSASSNEILWRNFINIGLTIILCVVLFREWYRQNQYSAKVFVSNYHRRLQLPEKIQGLLIKLNIKQTEKLLRYQPVNKSNTDIVNECLSLIWSAINDNAGTILETEGDSLVAFFEDSPLNPAHNNAVRSILLAKREIEDLDYQIKKKDPVNTTHWSVGFRIAIATGAIKPIWHEILDSRHAAWENVGDIDLFDEVDRYLEMGKQVTTENMHDSLIFMSEPLAQKLNDFFVRQGFIWIIRELPLPGKTQELIAGASVPSRKESFDV